MKTEICFLCCLIAFTGALYSEEGDSKDFSRSNWLLYLYEESPHYHYSRLIPLYSYMRYPDRLKEKFWLWPLLAGYEVSKNPAPTIFPYASEYEWYTLPFLSSGSLTVSPGEDMETCTMVSFLLMTYFQEQQREDRYFVREWYSLPLLSYYHSEILWEGSTQIHNTTWTNPLFSFEDVQLIHQQKIYPVYEWTIEPASLLLGEEGFQILHHARWGPDHLFEMFAMSCFALFTFSTTFSSYPGFRYQHFIQYQTDEAEGVLSLMKTSVSSPKNRAGILSPFIMIESSPVGYFSWQFLPLFYSTSEGTKSSFCLISLCLEFGEEGIRFSPQPKFFPLIYYDETYGRWDILWPLLHYTDNPHLPDRHINLRFIFDYRHWRNADNETSIAFSLLERLLVSYRRQYPTIQMEILPAGLLFSYYETESEYQWRILGCGYLETDTDAYLQLLFLKIPLGTK